jgi:hypothetical protein
MKRGIGREGFVKLFLTLFLVVAIAFVGLSFGKPYYRYNTLRSHTKDLLMSDLQRVDLIREDVMKDAEALNIPLEEENLSVVVTPKKIIKVKATWSETVDFWGYYQKQLDFVMETEY